MSQNDPAICLVGAGNMGGAMMSGWLESGYEAANISVIDPAPRDEVRASAEGQGVRFFQSAVEAGPADIIIVAVKPQMMDAVLPTLRPIVTDRNVVLSVAAGTTIQSLADPFAAVSPRVVRAMPNTPAQVKRGITVCVANDGVSEDQKSSISRLLEAIGMVRWVEDEGLIDAVTGVSGSGPAYVFHLVEAMAAAGVAAGLPADLAGDLARATVSGAGELLHQSAEDAAELRRAVTSPNGTTQAALEVLMAEDGFPQLLERAVAAATNRSRELAKQE